ncbi:hypothetical protein L596_029775 [Steinernema carpocapsae]|uniref:Uncharacterized protein n=1 Tax=Steinernema carpocapsae TaxID=34508 RepID=A0A4U5LQS4_STECR|nr:hypothetical protein L596_029775 [Steinernema carpocapsae]
MTNLEHLKSLVKTTTPIYAFPDYRRATLVFNINSSNETVKEPSNLTDQFFPKSFLIVFFIAAASAALLQAPL